MKRAFLSTPWKALVGSCLGAFVVLTSSDVDAQPRVRPTDPAAPPEVAPSNFRGRFGMELVQRLLRSSVPEERLRGIRRGAEQKTPESRALLASQAESNPSVRTDPRALVEVARALAPYAAEEGARAALISILNVQASASGARSSQDDSDPSARFELARATAALALARSGVGAAIESLFAAVRAQSVGTDAATRALAAMPPATIRGLGAATSLSPVVLQAVSKTEDLRAADVLLLALAAPDPRAKAFALVELAKKGDARALDPAKTLAKDTSPVMRVAAAQALVMLASKEAVPLLKTLFTDEGTAPSAVELTPFAENDDLVKLVAARAAAHPVFTERTAAIAALSRCTSPAAAKAIGALVLDKTVESEAAQALGRARGPHVDAWIIAMLRSPVVKRLGARAYVLRVLRGNPRISEADAALAALATAKDAESRVVGVFAQVALGANGTQFLTDTDPRVRAAAAMATRGKRDDDVRTILLRLAVTEKDDAARTALFGALSNGDPKGIVPSPLLVDRSESGAPEAPLAAYALARRSGEDPSEKVKGLVASKTTLVRSYALLGMAESKVRDVSGRLAAAYTYEPDPAQRRWLVRALVGRTQDTNAKARIDTLALAAELDPSPEVRFVARNASANSALFVGHGEADEIAWLRITGADGLAPQDSGYAALLLTSTGEVVPVVFDPDGYALVPAVPPGDTRLLLAPRFPKDRK